MNRYSRRRDPVLPKVTRVELDESNLLPRLLGVGIALAIAVAAFSYALNVLLGTSDGWQTVDSNSETGIITQFQLQYEFGTGTEAASSERRRLSLKYGAVMDEAYTLLSGTSTQVLSLGYLAVHPNEHVNVDPLVYRALEKAGSYALLGPAWEHFSSLFSCLEDSAAEHFDPAFDEASREYLTRLIEFRDNSEIWLELLTDDVVIFHASARYLDFCTEYEVQTPLDLGWLRNAFILDTAVEQLEALGFTHGMLTSREGFARSLSETAPAMTVYDTMSGTLRQTCTVNLHSASAVVSFRAFPLAEEDPDYYSYADGTVRAPYLRTDDASLTCKYNSLTAASAAQGCADLALQLYPAFTGQEELPDNIRAVICADDQLIITDADLQPENLYPGLSVTAANN